MSLRSCIPLLLFVFAPPLVRAATTGSALRIFDEENADVSRMQEFCSSSEQPEECFSKAARLSANADDAGLEVRTGKLKPRSKPSPKLVDPRPAPKERPSEFQQIAAAVTGQDLPIYGANLFTAVPETFAPVDQVPVSNTYVVGPGDELEVRVWGQVNWNTTAPVDRSGAIYLPRVGSLPVAGLQFGQLAEYLRGQIGKQFRNFDVAVTMGQLRTIQIFVVGHARRPGAYTVSSLSTLVNALFAAGGPSREGSMRHIRLKRGGHTVSDIDLYDLLQNGEAAGDARLMSGDVIQIAAAGPQIAVAGSVRNAAIFELKQPLPLDDVLHLAGGLAVPGDGQRIRIEHAASPAGRQVASVKLDRESAAQLVQGGDILRVESNLPRYFSSVTLRGNVSHPGRYPWTSGMRLRDLLDGPMALLTREYWTNQGKLGADPPQESIRKDDQPLRPIPAGKLASPDINWNYAVIERRDPESLSTRLVPFHLGKLIREHRDEENLPLEEGDVVTIFSQSDFKVSVDDQNAFVTLEGEVRSAGVFGIRPGETLGSVLQRTGGLTDRAYLYGAKFLRETTRQMQEKQLSETIDRLEQDLDESVSSQLAGASGPEQSALVQEAASSQRQMIARLKSVQPEGRIVLNLEPNSSEIEKLLKMPLQNGDRLIIPVRPITVGVLGAVYNPNTFLYEPQHELIDYLRRSGGSTRTGDPKRAFVIRADGSVLSRTTLGGSGFEHLRLYPGDTLVVPEQLSRSGKLRGVRDWTQVFAQAGLGAAALRVLR